MSQQNVETVRASFAAFQRGDFPAVLGTMDPEIEWHDPEVLPWGGSRRGHDAFGAHMQDFASHFEAVEVRPAEFLDAGDHVVVLGSLVGRAPAGEFEAPTVWVWELRAGRATRVRTFTDTASVLRALGRAI
jgi:uncharacterized protein